MIAFFRAVARPARVAALVVFVLLAGAGFLPLFGGPGYEQSLASGLVVPAAAAIATALDVTAASGASAPAPLACILAGVRTGGVLALVAFATALLHGVRVGICDFWGGSTFFFLTAGLGGPLGGIWGAVAGELSRGVGRWRGFRRRRLASVLLGLAGPLGGIAASVARFYASPMVFSYDPFFGYFSGTLYDTVVDVRAELWTYRGGTLATLLGAVLVALAASRSEDGRVTLRGGRGGRGRVALASGAAFLVVSGIVTGEGASLGHWQTASTIARALGGQVSGARCDVFYPDSLAGEAANLLERDCEEELTADERRLGTHFDGRLTVFAFADANEKRRLMGAADTSIAKPWRREVYVQVSGYPHPVLGHEVAHVVAGTFARGPFKVGGGLWPNPGLIEGVAVATSPDDDELTDAQWARAMLDLGILPAPGTIFSLGFLGESAQKSYTVAGAFVGWVLDRWGAAVVRGWYGGASLEGLTSESWDGLGVDFRAWLETLPMPPAATAYARARFDRPSVWARTCPHVVDALDRDGDRCQGEHRYVRADAYYAGALERDPRDYHALLARARMAAHGPDADAADVAGGRDALARLAADDRAPRTWRDRALEALADDDLSRGIDDRAGATYRAIAERTPDEDQARTLEIKALAASGADEKNPAFARRAIVDLLLAEPGHAGDSWLGGLSLGAWAERSSAPLAAYLIGRNLVQHEQWGRAAPWLDRSIEAGLPSARIAREALRQRATCACVLGDGASIARLRTEVTAANSPFAAGAGGRQSWLLRLLDRCAPTR